MPYIEYIKPGITYLLKSQKMDGGVSVGEGNTVSSVWATAEVLEALLSTVYLEPNIYTVDRVLKMAEFLIDSFEVSQDDDDCGYWKAYDQDRNLFPSTMTTGHSIYSLQLCINRMLCNYKYRSLISKINYPIEDTMSTISKITKQAAQWLFKNLQRDNGWSETEKDRGHQSSIVCSYYVMRIKG